MKPKKPFYGVNYNEKLVRDLSTNDNLKGEVLKRSPPANSEVKTMHWSDLPESDEFFQYMLQRVIKRGDGK